MILLEITLLKLAEMRTWDYKMYEQTERTAGKGLDELLKELRECENPVTYWTIKQCIYDRLERNDLS